jgi:Uri superfamily endonuclease
MEQIYQSYQLHIRITKEKKINIGKLGNFIFYPGYYVYTGSAKKNMDARIKRHQSKKKKIRWHIDYLLSHNDIQIVHIEQFEENECMVNQTTEGDNFVPKFGASDCKSGCGSHLKYLKRL